MPWDLAEAIGHAQRVLNWYANLPEKDIPPMWMWLFPEAQSEWFAELDFRRNRDIGKPNDTREQVPMTENDDPRMVAFRRGK